MRRHGVGRFGRTADGDEHGGAPLADPKNSWCLSTHFEEETKVPSSNGTSVFELPVHERPYLCKVRLRCGLTQLTR